MIQHAFVDHEIFGGTYMANMFAGYASARQSSIGSFKTVRRLYFHFLQRDPQSSGDNLSHFGIDTLPHLNSRMTNGHCAIMAVHGNVNFVIREEVMDGRTGWHDCNPPLLPSVCLKPVFSLIKKANNSRKARCSYSVEFLHEFLPLQQVSRGGHFFDNIRNPVFTQNQVILRKSDVTLFDEVVHPDFHRVFL